MKTVRLLLAGSLLAILVAAAPAKAQEIEPLSSGVVTATTVSTGIYVFSTRLTVTVTAVGVSGECLWNFGDGNSGTGPYAVHTYAAGGIYDITLDCSGVTAVRSIALSDYVPSTGFETLPRVLSGIVFIGLGALVVRRARQLSSD